MNICNNLASSVDEAKNYMGITSIDNHDIYKAWCPEGYELVWVDDPTNERSCKGWTKAIKIYQSRLKAGAL
jgi:hypothetical protein